MLAQGVKADFLSGSQSQEESTNVFTQLWRGEVGNGGLTLLYVTPERIVASPGFSKALVGHAGLEPRTSRQGPKQLCYSHV